MLRRSAAFAFTRATLIRSAAVIAFAAAPAFLIALAASSVPLAQAETAVAVPAPALDAPAGDGLETAVIAGGCFWGIQAIYQHVNGVANAVSGYAGGTQKDAAYYAVGSGRTGHAEAVKVVYDPKQISYGKILQIYFSVAHDPTQLDRQGPDTGPQYRSEIFPQNEEQAKVAKAYIAQLDAAKTFRSKIVTKIAAPKTAFYPAEGYHQDYAVLHPNQPYIVFNDAPKVANLKKTFPDVWRERPVTVTQAGGVGG
jgi:peptide-methionine (S)-S-oxide reductase